MQQMIFVDLIQSFEDDAAYAAEREAAAELQLEAENELSSEDYDTTYGNYDNYGEYLASIYYVALETKQLELAIGVINYAIENDIYLPKFGGCDCE